jgi:pyruvate dehydrogenase E2 component (dihydrolipoamide acetyltransferase)
MMVPIISPPQVGILGVGSIVERPWARQGWVGARRVVTVTLAGDHRASDGRSGARMLELLSKSLERPESL